MKCTSLSVTGPRTRLYGKQLHDHLSPPPHHQGSLKEIQHDISKQLNTKLLSIAVVVVVLMARCCVWGQHLNTYWFR